MLRRGPEWCSEGGRDTCLRVSDVSDETESMTNLFTSRHPARKWAGLAGVNGDCRVDHLDRAANNPSDRVCTLFGEDWRPLRVRLKASEGCRIGDSQRVAL